MPEATETTAPGRNALLISVGLCLLSLPVGLFAAPVLTTVSAPVSYLSGNFYARSSWIARRGWIATGLGVATGAVVSLTVLIAVTALLL